MGIFNKLFNKKEKQVLNTSEIVKQIDYKEGTLFAQNHTNKVYMDIEELGGFPYLKTVVIGDTKANIKRKGCSVSFLVENEEILLNSDNTTIESNEINNSGVYFTPIDFELDEQQAKKIQSKKVSEVKFTFKQNIVALKTI